VYSKKTVLKQSHLQKSNDKQQIGDEEVQCSNIGKVDGKGYRMDSNSEYKSTTTADVISTTLWKDGLINSLSCKNLSVILVGSKK
jgi:hypothetical protein